MLLMTDLAESYAAADCRMLEKWQQTGEENSVMNSPFTNDRITYMEAILRLFCIWKRFVSKFGSQPYSFILCICRTGLYACSIPTSGLGG